MEQARTWYREDDAVHGFGHIRRVHALCREIGQAERADIDILLAAALLHDAQGSHPGENSRNDHHLRSAQFAGEVLEGMGWPEKRIQAVQHCIRAHRFRDEEQPQTLEAQVLFDADKLDVIGAVGVVRALAYALQISQPVFAEPSARFVQTGQKEPGESHSAYHEYLFKLKKISTVLITPTARRMAASRQAFLDSFFEGLAAEMRAGESGSTV
jgi:uncharacterized protein